MIKIVIVSHNNLAESFLNAAEMICGKQESVKTFGLMPNQSHDDLYQRISKAYKPDDEVLFMIDLFGGTPYNEAHKLVENNSHYALYSNLNLAILIEALLSRENFEKAKDLLEKLTSKTKTIVQTKNNHQSDKPIEYVLSRIDSRLLHGQIATAWKNEVKPDRIIVVSDKIAHDELRKQMIVKACPSDLKANVVPVSKMAEVDKDGRFNGIKALLLFEEPSDLLEAVKAGVRIKHVNIGSISQKDDRINVGSAVSLNKQDVAIFKELMKLGLTFDVRKVPSDADEDIKKLIKKVEGDK